MGRAKEEWIEHYERGWTAPEDKFVCQDCVDDEFLKREISENLAKRKCDYCGKGSRGYIAAPVAVIMEPIAAIFLYNFSDPTQAGVPYDGGFVIKPTDTQNALLSLPLNCNDALFEDIADSFAYTDWVRTAGGHWASSHPSEILAYAWENFVRVIKHRTRFFFHMSLDPYDPESLAPSETLSKIAAAVTDLELIKSMPTGTVVFRAREQSNGEAWPLNADQLGAPPEDRAQAQRMNPPGISYLYLAKEKETALAEVLSKPPSKVAVGTFKLKRSIQLLDLSQLPSFPSIFDQERRQEMELLQFLYGFVEEISKPVLKDGREHVEYIPSQVVCEYFAKMFACDGEVIDGIAYPSSVRPGGINIVLFPPASVREGFKDLVELKTAEELSLSDWEDFFKAIR